MGTELLGLTLSPGMFARQAVSLDLPLSAKWLLRCQNPWCARCQRKVNSHIPFLRTSLGTVHLLAHFQQTHRLIRSRACLWSRWSLLPPSPLLSSLSSVWIALDLTGLYLLRGYLITLKKRGEKTFTQYIIKTVTLCHLPTHVLITLQDNVPARVTTISASSERSSFLSQCPKGTVTLTLTLRRKTEIKW